MGVYAIVLVLIWSPVALCCCPYTQTKKWKQSEDQWKDKHHANEDCQNLTEGRIYNMQGFHSFEWFFTSKCRKECPSVSLLPWVSCVLEVCGNEDSMIFHSYCASGCRTKSYNLHHILDGYKASCLISIGTTTLPLVESTSVRINDVTSIPDASPETNTEGVSMDVLQTTEPTVSTYSQTDKFHIGRTGTGSPATGTITRDEIATNLLYSSTSGYTGDIAVFSTSSMVNVSLDATILPTTAKIGVSGIGTESNKTGSRPASYSGQTTTTSLTAAPSSTPTYHPISTTSVSPSVGSSILGKLLTTTESATNRQSTINIGTSISRSNGDTVTRATGGLSIPTRASTATTIAVLESASDSSPAIVSTESAATAPPNASSSVYPQKSTLLTVIRDSSQAVTATALMGSVGKTRILSTVLTPITQNMISPLRSSTPGTSILTGSTHQRPSRRITSFTSVTRAGTFSKVFASDSTMVSASLGKTPPASTSDHTITSGTGNTGVETNSAPLQTSLAFGRSTSSTRTNGGVGSFGSPPSVVTPISQGTGIPSLGSTASQPLTDATTMTVDRTSQSTSRDVTSFTPVARTGTFSKVSDSDATTAAEPSGKTLRTSTTDNAIPSRTSNSGTSMTPTGSSSTQSGATTLAVSSVQTSQTNVTNLTSPSRTSNSGSSVTRAGTSSKVSDSGATTAAASSGKTLQTSTTDHIIPSGASNSGSSVSRTGTFSKVSDSGATTVVLSSGKTLQTSITDLPITRGTSDSGNDSDFTPQRSSTASGRATTVTTINGGRGSTREPSGLVTPISQGTSTVSLPGTGNQSATYATIMSVDRTSPPPTSGVTLFTSVARVGTSDKVSNSVQTTTIWSFGKTSRASTSGHATVSGTGTSGDKSNFAPSQTSLAARRVTNASAPSDIRSTRLAFSTDRFSSFSTHLSSQTYTGSAPITSGTTTISNDATSSTDVSLPSAASAISISAPSTTQPVISVPSTYSPLSSQSTASTTGFSLHRSITVATTSASSKQGVGTAGSSVVTAVPTDAVATHSLDPRTSTQALEGTISSTQNGVTTVSDLSRSAASSQSTTASRQSISTTTFGSSSAVASVTKSSEATLHTATTAASLSSKLIAQDITTSALSTDIVSSVGTLSAASTPTSLRTKRFTDSSGTLPYVSSLQETAITNTNLLNSYSASIAGQETTSGSLSEDVRATVPSTGSTGPFENTKPSAASVALVKKESSAAITPAVSELTKPTLSEATTRTDLGSYSSKAISNPTTGSAIESTGRSGSISMGTPAVDPASDTGIHSSSLSANTAYAASNSQPITEITTDSKIQPPITNTLTSFHGGRETTMGHSASPSGQKISHTGAGLLVTITSTAPGVNSAIVPTIKENRAIGSLSTSSVYSATRASPTDISSAHSNGDMTSPVAPRLSGTTQSTYLDQRSFFTSLRVTKDTSGSTSADTSATIEQRFPTTAGTPMKTFTGNEVKSARSPATISGDANSSTNTV